MKKRRAPSKILWALGAFVLCLFMLISIDWSGTVHGGRADPAIVREGLGSNATARPRSPPARHEPLAANRVRVIDAQGLPIGGARVEVFRMQAPHLEFAGASGPDGIFVLPTTAQGMCRIQASWRGFAAVSTKAAFPAEVVISLKRGTAVYLDLAEHDSGAWEDVSIRVIEPHGGPREYPTTESRIAVGARAPGPLRVFLNYGLGQELALPWLLVPVNGPVTFRLPPPPRAEYRLRFEDSASGRLLELSTLRLARYPGTGELQVCDARLDLEAKSYSLAGVGRGSWLYHAQLPAQVVSGRLDLWDLKDVVVRVVRPATVLLRSKRPVVRFRCHILASETTGLQRHDVTPFPMVASAGDIAYPVEGGTVPTLLDAQIAPVVFSRVGPGLWQADGICARSLFAIVAEDADGQRTVFPCQAPGPGGRIEEEVPWPIQGGLDLTIVDQAGTPANGIRVAVARRFKGLEKRIDVAITHTDGLGMARFRGLRSDAHYSLRISGSGMLLLLPLPERTQIRLVKHRLTLPGKPTQRPIVLKVSDQLGPVEGALVQWLSISAEPLFVYTDADGVATAGAAVDEAIGFRVTKPGYRHHTTSAEAEPPLEVTLHRLSVLDIDVELASSKTRHVIIVVRSGTRKRRFSAMVSGRGLHHIKKLDPGEYEVWLEDAKRTALCEPTRVVLVEGSSQRLSLRER